MKNKNSKLNAKKPKNKITNTSKHNIKPKMKLNKIKTINTGDTIISINFFKNFNFLILTYNKCHIYSPKFALIKTIDLDYEIKEIKITDNENFKCLFNYELYVNINIKNNEVEQIIDFGRKDIKYIKYYKKSIIAIKGFNTIFIWDQIEKNKYQFITKIELDICGEDIFVFEQYDLLFSCASNLIIYNLKKNKIDSILEELNFSAAMPFYENHILFLGGDYECGINDLSVYNIKEKKVIKNKEFDFYFYQYDININYTNLIKYYKKKDVIILCGGKNEVYNSIYVLDRNFNLIQTLDKIHYKNILGLAIYERGINDLILSYSTDGEIYFYSIS